MAKKTTTTIASDSIMGLINSIAPEAEILSDSKYSNSDDFIPTGIYILNACIYGSLFSGIPNRRSICLSGNSGTGKSFLAASICREGQKKGYIPVVMDSEGSWDKEFAERIGVDTKKLIIYQVNTISEVSHFISNLCLKLEESKSKDKFIVVIDSIGNLTSDKERTDTIEGNDKRDMTKQQELKALFRVNGMKLAKLGIPLIVNSHIYTTQTFIPQTVVSGGSAIAYNPSITLLLTTAMMDDKESDRLAERANAEVKKTGVVVTATPIKSRFCRPIKVRFQIPFFKKPNPYIGLDKFMTWENSGIVRGSFVSDADYAKLSEKEQNLCLGYKSKDGSDRHVIASDKSKFMVVRHLDAEVPVGEFFTSKVFTDEFLHNFDETVIRPTFELPAIDSLEDIKDYEDSEE